MRCSCLYKLPWPPVLLKHVCCNTVSPTPCMPSSLCVDYKSHCCFGFCFSSARHRRPQLPVASALAKYLRLNHMHCNSLYKLPWPPVLWKRVAQVCDNTVSPTPCRPSRWRFCRTWFRTLCRIMPFTRLKSVGEQLGNVRGTQLSHDFVKVNLRGSP